MNFIIVCTLIGLFHFAFALEQTCKHPNMISITIDDGPYAQITNAILNTLKQQKVKATFFVLGKQLTFPANVAALKRADKEGHIIASHTFNHPDLTALTDAQIVKEMNDTSDAIFAAIKKRPRLMRPPMGLIGDRSRAMIQGMGYEIIGWSIDTNDWKRDRQVNDMLKEVRGQVTNQKSGIVLLHDLFSHTSQVLPGLIKILKDNKSQIVNLDKCLDIKDVYFKNYVAMDPNNPKNPIDNPNVVIGEGGVIVNQDVDGLTSGVEASFGKRGIVSIWIAILFVIFGL